MKKFFCSILIVMLAVLTTAPVSAQDKTIKRKVAIGRFTNETQYGKGLFYDKENDPMRKQALDILSSKLAQSGKFILLEREDLDVLVKEAGGSMNKIGADYIILGSITEFGRKNEGHEQVFSSTKTQTVEAGVSIRLVETATGLRRGQGLCRDHQQTDAGHRRNGRLRCHTERQGHLRRALATGGEYHQQMYGQALAVLHPG